MDKKLHAALLDIVGMLNSPRYDDILLSEAGVGLDRALFPILVRIDSLGPISIADIAESVGRDHSTISRQVDKLQALGYVTRETHARDQRVRLASITQNGKTVATAIAAARDRLFRAVLEDWTPEDRRALVRLNSKLAQSMKHLAQRQRPS